MAPDIVGAILGETLPPELTLFDLAVDPPTLWEEQRGWIGSPLLAVGNIRDQQKLDTVTFLTTEQIRTTPEIYARLAPNEVSEEATSVLNRLQAIL